MVVALAVATHISVEQWLKEGDEAIATAIEILQEQAEEAESG
jgi:hypothetical protein